jgi:ABC-type uncharacterized transport system involved in gliding motility auxiliary subunit
LQTHLDDVEKQLRTLRSGGENGKTEAVITPEQREAIDTARQDILQTRGKLRAVQLELNRDISRLETEMRVFTIVVVPLVLTVVAITMGILQRRRRARARR